MCNLGPAGISGNSSLLTDFTAYANNALRSIWHLIFKSFGGWQYDDNNQTDLPSGVIDLNSNQTSYALPPGALTVRGIEILSSDGSTWRKLLPITEEQIRDRSAVGEFFNTSSTPVYYQLVGPSVKLYPAANYTVTGGFKVFFDRGSVAFASSDTTATPGFASEYHDLVGIESSIMHLEIKSPSDPTLAGLRLRRQDRRNDLKEFYNKRFREMFPTRLTARDPARENM